MAGLSPAIFPEPITDSACLAFTASPWASASRFRSPARRALSIVPPVAPTGLAASLTGRTLTLTWVTPAASDAATTYVLEVGSAAGRSDLTVTDTGSSIGSLVATGVPAGRYFVRVRTRSAAGTSQPSNEIVVGLDAPCTGAPDPPSSLTATAIGSSVTLAWQAAAGGCAAVTYVVEAGSSPGLSNLASFPTGSLLTTFSTSGVPNGTYYVRVRAANPSGPSAPSNDARLTVGATGCSSAPDPPSGLSGSVTGATVVLTWAAPASGCAPTSYFLEAGSATGLSDLAALSTGGDATSFSATDVPVGTYFVRVRSVNTSGRSGPSNEAQVIVGSAAPVFGSGIFYRLPTVASPAAQLARIGTPPTVTIAQMPPAGWDMCRDFVVFPASTGLTLVTTSGQQRTVAVTDIFNLARPSLSADCRYVAVQATNTSAPPSPTQQGVLTIYVVDLQARGPSRQIGLLPENQESPRFFPSGHRLAYSSFSPASTNLHVFDLDQSREVALLQGIGALQIAISPDGTQFVDPRKMRIYSVSTGALVADLLNRTVQSVQAAGFQLDQRFDDLASGFDSRGVYPLDASFSPTGQQLVLDWAVQRSGTYGNILATMTISSGDFSVLTGLLPTNPQFTNSNNFSQLNPLWK